MRCTGRARGDGFSVGLAPCSQRPWSPGRQRSAAPGAAKSGLDERSGRVAGCLSHARTRAAARRCPVRQDQGRKSPAACVRAQTPRDCRGGCRATLGAQLLKVEQGAYRVLPALRSRAAVLRPAVMQARLLCLAALPITPLSLDVGQSHGHCAPLRNGADGAAAVWSAVSPSAAAARWRERLLSMAVRRR